MLRMHNMYVLHSHTFIQICAIYIYMHGSQYAHLRWGGKPSPPGMKHVLAPSHMPIHTLQKSTRNDLYASSRPPQTIVTTKTTTYGCCLFGHWVDSPPLCLHRVLCLLGGPLDHGMFSLLLLRTEYVVCISARCRPPAVANFASHAAFRQSAP